MRLLDYIYCRIRSETSYEHRWLAQDSETRRRSFAGSGNDRPRRQPENGEQKSELNRHEGYGQPYPYG